MEAPIHAAAAAGYARASGAYERGRPGYPEEALALLAGELGVGSGTQVVDLAAGTGKLTRGLVALGAEVVAVEPVAEMRQTLAAELTSVTALAGTAEALPLADESVDVVAVGQAFHWFRGDEALAEIHRVLRPDGGLGLLWNLRDESVGWVAELTAIMAPHRGSAPRAAPAAWREAFGRTARFGPLRHASFPHAHRLTPAAVAERVASVSFVAALPEPERERVLERVHALLAADPETRGRAEVELPYRTDVYWCERR